jgi:hypothetical protein
MAKVFLIVKDRYSHNLPSAGIFAEEKPVLLLIGVSRPGKADGDVQHVGVSIIREFKLSYAHYGRCHKTLPFGSRVAR